jgi:hypothetical protein
LLHNASRAMRNNELNAIFSEEAENCRLLLFADN